MIEAELRTELDQIIASGRQRELTASARIEAGHVELRSRSLIDFSSWDYFGIRTHRTVKRTTQATIENLGVSSPSPRLSSGTDEYHLRLEQRIAQFLGHESALLFSSRNQAHLSWISALCSEQDIVLIDERSQLAVSDAAYLVGAEVEQFKDIFALAPIFERRRTARRKFIVLEGVSPTSGYSYDLIAASTIAKRNNALLVLDESAAFGMLGLRGAGAGEVLSLKTREPLAQHVFLSVSDLSTGLGGYGAALASSRLVINYLLQRSRTFSHEIPLPPALCAAMISAIDIIELLPLEREIIAARAERLARAIPVAQLLPRDSSSAIVALTYPKLSKASEVAQALFQRGVLCELLLSPTPLSASAMLRFIVRSEHSDILIDVAVRIVGEVLGVKASTGQD